MDQKIVKAILLFDPSVPIDFVGGSGGFFRERGVGLVYLNGVNEIDAKRWKVPASMSDRTILKYAECLWALRCLELRYFPPAFFICRDRDFKTIKPRNLPAVLVTQGNSGTMKARMMLDIGKELEVHIPGIARDMLQEMRRRGFDLSEELL